MFATHNRTDIKRPTDKSSRAGSALGEKTAFEQNPIWQSLAINPAAIQPKLSVSQPYDPDEREADRVADRVMRMPSGEVADGRLATFSNVAPRAQRSQRDEEEEGKLQRQEQRGVVQSSASSDRGPLQEGGQPLNSAVRSFFEPRFGRDFGNVRIHTGQHAAHQAESLQAEAFTVGSNIAFNLDRFQPNTSSGRRLLAHELTHVVQQRTGQTRATRIQREAFQRVPAEAPRTPAQIRAMTLAEFESLATRQLDWFTSPSLNTPAAAADLALFRQILDFSREQPIILPTCGSMLVSDVIAAAVPGVFVPLRAYARGAASTARNTAWLRTTNNVNTAVGWGNDLTSLEGASDPATLRMTMPQPDPLTDPSPFERLVAGPYIADFVNYLNTCHPVLSATDGWEVVSYALLRGEGVDPVTYVGGIDNVRDYHHFTRDALDGLVLNEAVTTAQQQIPIIRRPLTLVLHTTIDHNHAFHRTAGMTALIREPRILTIVLEGLPTLAGYQGQLGAIAARYGIGGRIEQVLIAGHGNFGVVGLAGTVAAGVVQEEQLTNTGSAAQIASTENLVRALVAVMNADPARRRIALAACLTASHSVTSPVDPNNPATASTQIRNAIAANPNIRDFLQNLVGAGSTVIGVRASQPAQTFLDPSGRVALNVPDDPQIMGSVVDYIESGTEPEGALRTLVEGWATDHATAPAGTLSSDAVNRRLLRPVGGIDWYEQVILGIYDRVLNHYWANGAMINWFTARAGFLGHLYWAGNDQAAHLWAWMGGLPAADIDGIFTRLTTSSAWGLQLRIRLLLNQVWMRHIPARGANFLTELAQYATCGEAVRYLDMNVVRPVIGALLTVPPPAVPDPGQLRLALIEAAVNPLPRPAPVVLPPHVQFLRALLAAGPNFPPALNIGGLTAGLTDEAGILVAIDRSPAAPAPPVGGVVPLADRPRANVDLNRNGVNDFFLEPFAKSGTVANCVRLHVRSRPWIGDNIRDSIAAGVAVRIVGRHLNWFGIEHGGRIRFVHSAFVQVPP